MAHETDNRHNRIVRDPAIHAGQPVVKGTQIVVAQVLARLANNPDVDELVRDYPELTRDDVQAVLAFAQEQETASPGFVSPQQFYREATRREDVKRILDALAK